MVELVDHCVLLNLSGGLFVASLEESVLIIFLQRNSCSKCCDKTVMRC